MLSVGKWYGMRVSMIVFSYPNKTQLGISHAGQKRMI